MVRGGNREAKQYKEKEGKGTKRRAKENKRGSERVEINVKEGENSKGRRKGKGERE